MPPVIGVSRHALWEVIGLERDGKPETRKPARGGLLGVFRRLSETARPASFELDDFVPGLYRVWPRLIG